jgi:predicted porin
MTAFAGAAQAQSSVTVYGILDVGFVGSQYNGTSVAAGAANSNNAILTGNSAQKQTTAGFGQSAESTSRIGFKGNEDLGGGLSAVFTLELGLSPNSNSYSYSATAGSPPSAWGQINRQSFVGLSKTGLGTATIGTQYTPLFDVQSITDAAGNNNLVGNAVYSGNLQSTSGTFNNGLQPFAGSIDKQSINAVSGAYTTRASNALKLQSANFAGLQGQLYYAQANQTSNQTAVNFTGTSATNAPGGVNNNSVFGANANYVWNKLQVVAAYQQLRSYDPSAAVITPALAGGTADSFGTNMNDQQVYAAATYDFGILKGYAQYITRKAFSVQDSATGTQRSAYQLGARSQLTPVISVYATYGLGKSSYYQAGTAYANFRTTQLGADYNLSKRTNLYVAYGSDNQSNNGAAGANQVAGTSAMNYAAGIRHTF